jgi:hypothetical protein
MLIFKGQLFPKSSRSQFSGKTGFRIKLFGLLSASGALPISISSEVRQSCIVAGDELAIDDSALGRDAFDSVAKDPEALCVIGAVLTVDGRLALLDVKLHAPAVEFNLVKSNPRRPAESSPTSAPSA